LFFQVGDFYELFFEDAVKVAPLLDLTLTSRQKINGEPVPMCGVPLAAGEGYINRLASLGYRVSVCDQENAAPPPGEKVARRVVKRVVTPGTILTSEDESPKSRYLALIYQLPPQTSHQSTPPQGQKINKNQPNPYWYLAGIDLSTGDFILDRHLNPDTLAASLTSLEPQEILYSPTLPFGSTDLETRFYQNPLDTGEDNPLETLTSLFGENFPAFSLLLESPGAIEACGYLLGYLLKLSPGASHSHISPPRLLWSNPHLFLDEGAIRNLELFRSSRDGGTKGTLLSLMDRTATPMGLRLLKDWLTRPSRLESVIQSRHGAVGEFLHESISREKISRLLKEIRDLERALSRISLQRGTIRDLYTVQNALTLAPQIQEILKTFEPQGLLYHLGENLTFDHQLTSLLKKALAPNLPPGSPEGAALQSGLSPKLDYFRDLEVNAKKRLAALEGEERGKTNIPNLKVGYTRVFGYFLEVTKSYLKLVPQTWTRKQTLSGGERYVTLELSELEENILTAASQKEALENRILTNLKARVSQSASALKQLSGILAQLDALGTLAETAQKYNWVRPELTENDYIHITLGRHPVVEASLPPGETFVANDTLLSPKERLLIITGPNMAGKSTILRQVALIVILNQMGSFVPAQSAKLSIRDAVFTRVGAADDLARGLSTFMVEMRETARILQLATSRSLVILDEVGRGTSTYDGLAIAWAVAEYLHDRLGRGVPTLFATHYHELIDLPKSKPLTINYNVTVKKWEGKVIFLRKLAQGGTSHSYGLACAALAGLPKEVIKRAGEVLADLTSGAKKIIRPQYRLQGLFPEAENPDTGNLPLKPDPLTPTEAKNLENLKNRLLEEIVAILPETLTPLEALNILADFKARASEILS
jgi:DNA mismatch repair protein MutS